MSNNFSCKHTGMLGAADQGLPPNHPDYCFCDGTIAPVLTHTNGKTDCNYKTQPASNIPLGTLDASQRGGAISSRTSGHMQGSLSSSEASGPSSSLFGSPRALSSGLQGTHPGGTRPTLTREHTGQQSGSSSAFGTSSVYLGTKRIATAGSKKDRPTYTSGNSHPSPSNSGNPSKNTPSGTNQDSSHHGPDQTLNPSAPTFSGGSQGSSNGKASHTQHPSAPSTSGGERGPSKTGGSNSVTNNPVPGQSSNPGGAPNTGRNYPTQTPQYSAEGLFEPSYTAPIAVITHGGYVETYSREVYPDLASITAITTVTTTYESTGTGGVVAIATGPVIVGPGGVWWRFGGISGGGAIHPGGGPP
ncbi:MAG: hypothetical protein Q9194_004893, partial [Teloschistes cf. exilis]